MLGQRRATGEGSDDEEGPVVVKTEPQDADEIKVGCCVTVAVRAIFDPSQPCEFVDIFLTGAMLWQLDCIFGAPVINTAL